LRDEDKSIKEFEITDVDPAWVPPDNRGDVRIVLCTAHEYDVSLRFPPEILAKLEARLAQVRDAQTEMGGHRH
jgi:hypothetical protein